jgi:hypothetical protein
MEISLQLHQAFVATHLSHLIFPFQSSVSPFSSTGNNFLPVRCVYREQTQSSSFFAEIRV